MRCIERAWPLAALVALAGCGSKPSPAPPAATTPAVAATPAAAAAPATTAPAAPNSPAAPAAPAEKANSPRAALPPASPSRDWAAFKRQAAQRMVRASPGASYTGAVPEPLLAIPVLEIDLNADGSVRRIGVLRRPSQAQDTVQLAIDAVRRAAPFGDVSRLPRPWRITEAFLFDDARRFKPRTLED